MVLATLLLWGCALNPHRSLTSLDPDCRSGVLSYGAPAGPVHWVIAADANESDELAAWCAAVGVPVRASWHEGEPEPVDSVLVVTWNVNVGGGDLLGFVSDLRAGKLTDGIPVRHFALMLQEVYRVGGAPSVVHREAISARRLADSPPDGERVDIVAAAHRLGLHLVYVPSMRNGRPGFDPAEDRGNAILSTLPLESPAAIELPLEWQRRVVTVATVRGRGSDGAPWSIRLASVHLDNRSSGDRLLDSFGAARMRQARALAAALANEETVVLAGDLNRWSLPAVDRAPNYLKEHFPDAGPSDGQPTLTILGVLPRRLDFILARAPNLAVSGPARVNDPYGSDHHAVIGWIGLVNGRQLAGELEQVGR